MCFECDRDAATMKRPWQTGGLLFHGGKNEKNFIIIYLMYSVQEFILREFVLTVYLINIFYITDMLLHHQVNTRKLIS